MTTTLPLDDPGAPDAMAEEASKHTLALNPLVGLCARDFYGAAGTIFSAAIAHPEAVAAQWLSFIGDLCKVASGEASHTLEPGDKRFNDPAWKTSAVHRALLQSYLALDEAVNAFVERLDLGQQEKARAKLISQIFVDSVAPSNSFANPAALKKLVDSGGESLWSGLKNYIDDLVSNGGMPSQVDTTPFELGKNIATTPGAVVFRNEILELIQYTPVTPEVWQRPLVITPPQINKFYSLDLSPEKSMLRFLLSQGIQVFCISWRNPTAEQRDWGLDSYIEGLDSAIDAARQITGSADVSLMGACSGGITSTAYVGLAGWQRRKQSEKPCPCGLHA